MSIENENNIIFEWLFIQIPTDLFAFFIYAWHQFDVLLDYGKINWNYFE